MKTQNNTQNLPGNPTQDGAMKVVDLFAGWGGFSLGAAQAGANLAGAYNHNPLAVRAHGLNHPEAVHVCQDLRQADWGTLPEFDLLLASPACQGHSQAAQPGRSASGNTRGYHDALRATAWAVVDCADATNPEAIVVENVPDFKRWRLFPLWMQALECLGYVVKEHLLTATSFGVPQRRQRLFITATRKAFELVVPEMKIEPAMGDFIDWDKGEWRPIEQAGIGAQRRIRLGQQIHGQCFFTQHVTGHKGVPLHEAIRTVTCADQWAVVQGELYRPLTIRETARAMGFPDTYGWPEGSTRRETIRGLGNAVCPPVAKSIVEQIISAR